MKVVIEGEPKEIADLVVAVQSRQVKIDFKANADKFLKDTVEQLKSALGKC